MTFSIAKKLVTFILLSSTVITTVFTTISFYHDYLNELDALDKVFIQIEKSYLDSISNALWDLDEEQIHSQMRGILNINDILSVTIESSTDEPVIIKKETSSRAEEYSYSHRFDLNFKNTHIGSLNVVATKLHLYQRLINRAFYFFITQGIKTLLVSMIIFFGFQMLVTRHITEIVNYIKKFNESQTVSPKKPVLKKSSNEDEIDYLLDNIHIAFTKISDYNQAQVKTLQQKDHQLEEHIQKSYLSAKLASIGEMAGGIAHEINNPLAIIDGNISIVERMIDQEKPDKSNIRKRIKKIQQMVSRIASIITGLRYFSRDASGEDYELTSTTKIIDDTVSLCHERFKSRGVKLAINSKSQTDFFCRPIQISQVLLNLLNNAFDVIESEESPEITIETFEKDDKICFTVSDNGPGIPNEIQDKILEPFFTTKPVGSGTGLGLSISKGIIESHQGSFYLDTRSPQTTFVILIPKNLQKAS